MFSNISNYKQRISDYLKNNFEVSTTRRSRITGIVFTAILLLIVIIDHRQFTMLEFKSKWILLGVTMIMPFIVGLTLALNITIKDEKKNKLWHTALLFLMPFATITMAEALNSVFIYNMTYLGFFGNYVLVLVFFLLFFALTGSIKVSFLVVNPIIYLLAVAHSYIMEFRGTPFIPMDFFNIKTAVGVADTYKYRLSYNVLIASIIFIWIIIVSIKMKTPKYDHIKSIISRVFTGAFVATLMILFYCTPVLAKIGVKPDFWNQSRGYYNYGFTLMFFCNTKYMYMSKPSGYDPDKIGDYVDHVVQKPQDKDDSSSDNSKKPNIICIMNESLADLSVLGEFTTNEDYMPFMHSLTENTIKGNLFVPVVGAGTSNTEFEFLTGHTTAFLPTGSNAYMLYIKKPLASLVSTLEGQNYSSYTMHPYFAAGWNRVNVYKNMGFDVFHSIENLLIPEMMNEYGKNSGNPNYLQSLADQYYPNSNLLVRQYISDEYSFNQIINNYENRDKSKPYFAFNVTMQNHGGYTVPPCDNFNEDIYVTSSQYVYPKVNQYLSLVKYTDNAFKELIEYFSNVDEPTVICMFGDHHPSVEYKFIGELLGTSNLAALTPEQEQARHITPFFIWANYDIEEKQIDRISSNYLSSLVLQTAGVKLTDYNKYLLKLMKELPVIDTVGYIDYEGNHYRWGSDSPYREKLNEYEQIQYNNIFDSGNKDTDIFYLEGYTGDEGVDLEAQENAKNATAEAAGKKKNQ